jgi:hypothetical protein
MFGRRTGVSVDEKRGRDVGGTKKEFQNYGCRLQILEPISEIFHDNEATRVRLKKEPQPLKGRLRLNDLRYR